MFNPADFDALKGELEKRFLRGPVDSNSAEYVSQRRAIATTRRLAESLGMMAPEPAPVRLCQECHAAPVNSHYSRLCEACYAIACEEIRAELAQEQPAACSNCGAAPELPYATLCQECYGRFIDEIEERRASAAPAKEEPTQEEEPQEYILIEPGQEPSGDEALTVMLPYSAAMLNSCFGKSKLRWLPTAEILGSPAIADASDDALEIVG